MWNNLGSNSGGSSYGGSYWNSNTGSSFSSSSFTSTPAPFSTPAPSFQPFSVAPPVPSFPSISFSTPAPPPFKEKPIDYFTPILEPPRIPRFELPKEKHEVLNSLREERIKMNQIEKQRVDDISKSLKPLSTSFTNTDQKLIKPIDNTFIYKPEPSQSCSSTSSVNHTVGLGVATELMMNGQRIIPEALNAGLTAGAKSGVAMGVATGVLKLGEPIAVAAGSSYMADKALSTDSPPPPPCSMDAFTQNSINGAITGFVVGVAESTPAAVSTTIATGGAAAGPAVVGVAVSGVVGGAVGSVLGMASTAIDCSMSLAKQTEQTDTELLESEQINTTPNHEQKPIE